MLGALTRWWALRSTPDRANIVGAVQDAEKDYTPYDRVQFISLMRQLEQNDAFVNRVLDLYDTYVFGATGIKLKAASEDETWNEIADETFEGFCRYPEISALRSFGQTQRIAGRSVWTDGDHFIILTSERAGEFIRPRIQLVEAHRCKTPTAGALVDSGIQITQQLTLSTIDGVQVDPATGRPLYYWFEYTDRLTNQKRFRRYAANQIVPLSDPTRAGQYRSPTIFASVINDINDLREWQGLTKAKIKAQSEIANIYHTKGGADKIQRAANRFAATPPPSNGQSIEDKVNALRQVLGARTVNIDVDESIKEHRSDQPADSQQRFWDTVAARAAAGVNLPLEVVFPRSIQGTMARAVFDMAQSTFAQWQAAFAEQFNRVRQYVILTEAQYNPALANLPRDWRNYDYTGPKGINVDIGYTARATLAELEAGLTTREIFHKHRNRDWRAVERQLAKEELYRREIRQQAGLPLETTEDNDNE